MFIRQVFAQTMQILYGVKPMPTLSPLQQFINDVTNPQSATYPLYILAIPFLFVILFIIGVLKLLKRTIVGSPKKN